MAASSYKEAVIEYLAKPENLELALDIYEYLPEVKKRLHIQFWRETGDRIKERLGTDAPGWKLTVPQGEEALKNWSGIFLRPDNAVDDRLSLGFGMQQDMDRGNFALYLGVCYSLEQKTEPAAPQVAALRQKLSAHLDSAKKDTWYLGYLYVDLAIMDKQGVMSLARGDGGLVERASDWFLDLVGELRPDVEAANLALAGA